MVQFLTVRYLFSLLFAAMLVAAQSCWKIAADKSSNPFQAGASAHTITSFVFSPLVVGGTVIYLFATFLYMFLLSHYEFSFVQSLAIPGSLIFSILVAITFFGETLSAVNYAGLLFVTIGIALLTLR